MASLETVLENQKQPKMVCIPREEYDSLIDDSMKLNSLERGGVDNWEWYGESMTDYWEWRDAKDEEEDDD